jgi:hypothetical protein
MKNRLAGKVLSLALSAAMAVTTAVPAYAAPLPENLTEEAYFEENAEADEAGDNSDAESEYLGEEELPAEDLSGEDTDESSEDGTAQGDGSEEKEADDAEDPDAPDTETLEEADPEEALDENYALFAYGDTIPVTVNIDVPADAGEYRRGTDRGVFYLDPDSGADLYVNVDNTDKYIYEGNYIIRKFGYEVTGLYLDPGYNTALPNKSEYSGNDYYQVGITKDMLTEGSDGSYSLNLYARTRKAEVHIVVFNYYDGGYKDTGKTIRVGEKYPSIAAPAEKFGYDFLGWYSDRESDHNTQVEINSDTVFDDIAYYYSSTQGRYITYVDAVWTPIEYTVNFHLNNGSTDVVETQKYKEHTARDTSIDISKTKGALSQNSSFTDDAVDFVGWALTPKGDVYFTRDQTAEDIRKYAASKKVTTIDVYAKWESSAPFDLEIRAFSDEEYAALDFASESFAEGDYRITSKEDLVQHDTSYVNEVIILSGNEFIRRGYTLVGWTYTKVVGGKETTVNLKPSDTIKETVKPDSAVLTAKWSDPVVYTVKYDLMGGELKDSKTQISFTYSKATVKEQTPLLNYEKSTYGGFRMKDAENEDVSRKGYKFRGWNMTGGNYRYYGGDVYEDLTLEAEWDPIDYTIILDADPGKLVLKNGESYARLEIDASYGQDISIRSLKYVRDGYTLKEWLDEETGRTYPANGVLRDLTDEEWGEVTLKAQWVGTKNTITYKLDGGALPSKDGKKQTNPTVYVTGEKTTLIAPEKKGYSFATWKVTEGSDAYLEPSVEGSTCFDTISEDSFGAVTLTAVYTPVLYAVNLYANVDKEQLKDASDNNFSLAFGYEESVNLSDYTTAVENLVKDEYLADASIISFNTKPDGKGTKYTLDKLYSKLSGSEGDVVELYAQYSKNKVYHLFYDLEGGSLKKPVATYAPGAAVKVPNPARTGYIFTGWTVMNDPDEGAELPKVAPRFAENEKTHALTILKSEQNSENLYLTANWESITYTVKVVDAYGVKGELIDGVVFNYDGSQPGSEQAGKKFSFDAAQVTGHAFAGLYTKKNGKGRQVAGGAEYFDGDSMTWKYPQDLFAGLSTKNGAKITLYSYYAPYGYGVYYNPLGFVEGRFNGDGTVPLTVPVNLETSIVIHGKSFKLPNVKVEGYTFLGWKMYNPETSEYSTGYYYDSVADAKASMIHPEDLRVTESAKGFVTSVNKDNAEGMVLAAVFTMNNYYVKLNLQGGTLALNPLLDKTNVKGNQVVAQLHYDALFRTSDLEGTARQLSRKGYEFAGIALDSKGKTMIMDSDRDYLNNFEYRSGLVSKKDGYFQTYVIWKKLKPVATDRIKAILTEGEPGEDNTPTWTLGVRVLDEDSDEHRYQVEYCSNSLFLKPSTEYIEDGLGVVVKGLTGKSYYVRVRSADYDSAGNAVTGKWSKAVRAIKQ